VLTDGILFTDHYQLTMAQLYHRYGLAGRTAQFDYYFRSYPDYGSHQAGYCITAGLGPLLDWMETTWFGEEEVAALRQVRTSTGGRLFEEPFIEWVRGSGGFGCASIWAVPEGRVVHPNTPILTVEAPLALAHEFPEEQQLVLDREQPIADVTPEFENRLRQHPHGVEHGPVHPLDSSQRQSGRVLPRGQGTHLCLENSEVRLGRARGQRCQQHTEANPFRPAGRASSRRPRQTRPTVPGRCRRR